MFHWVPSNGSTKPQQKYFKKCVYHLLRHPLQSARLLKSPIFLSSSFHTLKIYEYLEVIPYLYMLYIGVVTVVTLLKKTHTLPKFNMDPKMMVSKFGISLFLFGVIFRWTMLNFGRVWKMIFLKMMVWKMMFHCYLGLPERNPIKKKLSTMDFVNMNGCF